MYDYNRRIPGLSEYVSTCWSGSKLIASRKTYAYCYCFSSYTELSSGFAESHKVFVGLVGE